MDPWEEMNVILSKIKILDPENASKIMGYILLQDHSARDLQRLAFGSELLLQTEISNVKDALGLTSNMLSSLSAPSSPSPILRPKSGPNNISNPLSQASSRTTVRGSFSDFPTSSSPRPWPIPGLQQNNRGNSSICPKSSPLPYDSIRAGSAVVSPLTKNGDDIGGDRGNSSDFFPDNNQFYDFLLNDSNYEVENFVDATVQLGGFPVANGNTHSHRRKFSENDASLGAQDGGVTCGCTPCAYYAKGFCKHGENCKFFHSNFGGDNPSEVNAPGAIVGSSGGMKAAQQQQQQQQRSGAAGAISGDEFNKFGRLPSERNDSLAADMAEKASAASRQIFVRFPADSSFRVEDVSNYFSNFGLVQDVRIHYQKERMFAFVLFVNPETVKLVSTRRIHVICNSSVVVMPHKGKGKVPSSRTQQLLERGTHSPISSPFARNQGELYDSHIGPRTLYDTQEMMLRQQLEQAEQQQAIELQGRRLANLQLPDASGAVIVSSNGKNQQVSEGSVNGSDAAETCSRTQHF